MVTLRALEYILGFILVPYMIRTLGPMNFGMIAFMQGIMEYFKTCVDYGFSLTAPKAIAQAEESEHASLFATFFWSKIGIAVIVTLAFFLLCLVLYGIFEITLDILLFVAMYAGIIGNLLFPIWFFQGIQQMRYITILNMCGRIFTTLSIFVLVKDPSDYILAAFLQSCTPLLAGILSMQWIIKRYDGMFKLPSWGKLKRVHRTG